MSATFQWNDATITVIAPTGRTRLSLWRLKRLAGVYEMKGAQAEDAESALYLLSLVGNVEGDLGFPVPNGDATKETVLAFIDGLLDSPEELLIRWNGAVINATEIGNNPDLLPPDELDKTQKKDQKS